MTHHMNCKPRGDRIRSNDVDAAWSERSFHSEILFRADRRPLYLDGMYCGKSMFLVLGGPSIADTDLSLLKQPGIVTMSVNQSWAAPSWKGFRPNVWVGCDTPGKFVDVCWKDPTILKLVPVCQIGKHLRVKEGKKFRNSQFRVRDVPNIAFFIRNNMFRPFAFFHEDSVCWGTEEEAADSLGIRNSRCSMLCAIRFAWYFGIRKLYLVGADFDMPLDSDPYGFAQGKGEDGRKSNNIMYQSLGRRLNALAAVIAKENMRFEIINATLNSKLSVFPCKPYAEAVAEATKECSKGVTLDGWYDNIK